jgi:hypothetical protein
VIPPAVTYTSEVLRTKNVPVATRGSSNSTVSDQVAATLSYTSEMRKKKPAYQRQNAVEIPLERKEDEEEKEATVNPLANLVLLEGDDGILTICKPNGRCGLVYGREAMMETSRRPAKRTLDREQGFSSGQSETKKAKSIGYDADDESGRLTPTPLVIAD